MSISIRNLTLPQPISSGWYNRPPLATSVVPDRMSTHMPKRTRGTLYRYRRSPWYKSIPLTGCSLGFLWYTSGRSENNDHLYYDMLKSHTFISRKVETMTSHQLKSKWYTHPSPLPCTK